MPVVMTIITYVVKHLNVVKSLKCASELVYDSLTSQHTLELGKNLFPSSSGASKWTQVN